jgi:NAD(P)-dependent dehydrogenase (short-subunit alcohol dehydrogenase family)
LKIAGLRPKKLILGTRTIAKGEATKTKILAQCPSLDKSVIEVLSIEYALFDSVVQFAESVKQSTQTLDCVLLSAGVAMPSYKTSEGGWETALKVNVLSAALLAIELLPLLKNTPSSVLEFVGSVGHTHVTSEHVAPLIQDPSASTLAFFNSPDRWTVEKSYCEAKLLLMFVLEGLVESLGGSQGKLAQPQGPVLLACCPGQCKTDLGRDFPLTMRLFMKAWNSFMARSADVGSRTLVTGLQQGEQANGRIWVNDAFDIRSPALTETEWRALQKRVWGETVDVLKKYKPDLAI